MSQFILIPKEFLNEKANTKFLDVLIYAIIRSCETNGQASIAYKTISDKYKISVSQIEKAVARLEETGLMSHKQAPSDKHSEYVYNIYKFKDCRSFVMLNPELLNLPYNAKERGFLIYLQLCCVEGTNQAMSDGLIDQLNIDKRTYNKYIKFFKSHSEIEITRWGNINCKYAANTPLISNKQSKIEIIL